MTRRTPEQTGRAVANNRARWNERYATEPEFRAAHKARYRWYMYRMRPADYDAMYERQNGLCPCGLPLAEPMGPDTATDHDHAHCPGDRSCGDCVRGLLHQECNRGIGLVADSPARLRRLADYLERSQE